MVPFDSSHWHGCFFGIKGKHADDSEYGSWLAGYIHTYIQTNIHTYITYIRKVVQQWRRVVVRPAGTA
jgi:hypothetical protein